MLLWIGFVAAAAAALVVLDAVGVKTSQLTRDAAAVAKQPPHVGLISTLGVMLWAATAGACLLAARALSALADDPERAEFLLATGAMLAALGIDDGLQVHENARVPELVVYGLYGVVVLLYVTRYRELMLEEGRLLLGLGFGCLVLSAALDVPGVVPFTVEDFPKLTGLVALTAWAFSRSLDPLTRTSVR
jgi:hypothetical protein